jgi:hypothetical protein
MAGMGQSLGQSSAARMAEEAGLRTGALDRQALLEKAQFEMAGLQRAKAMGDRERVQKHTLELQKLESQLRERQGATSGTLAGQEMAAMSREELAAARAEATRLGAEATAEARTSKLEVEKQAKADLAIKNDPELLAIRDRLKMVMGETPAAKAKRASILAEATEVVKRIYARHGITMPEAPSVPSSGGQKEISWANLPPSK